MPIFNKSQFLPQKSPVQKVKPLSFDDNVDDISLKLAQKQNPQGPITQATGAVKPAVMSSALPQGLSNLARPAVTPAPAGQDKDVYVSGRGRLAIEERVPKTEEESIDDIIKNLLAGNPDRSKARESMDTDLRVAKAEQIASTRSRAGLGGMGLTGAAGALEGQEARKAERNRIGALDQFDTQGREEDLQRSKIAIDMIRNKQEAERAKTGDERERIAFEAALRMAEEESGLDLDNDGKIGGPQGKSKEEFEKGVTDQEAKAEDQTNPSSAGNISAFQKETGGGDVNAVINWGKKNGKDMTPTQTYQVAQKYKEYQQRGGKGDFNSWFKAESDSYDNIITRWASALNWIL